MPPFSISLFSQRPYSKPFWLLPCLLLVLQLPLAAQPSLQDSSQVVSLINLGKEELRQDKLDTAELYFEQAVALAKEIGFEVGISRTLSDYLRVLIREGKYKESMELAQLGLKISKKQGTRAVAVAENNVGLMHWYLGNLEAATDHYLKALQLSRALNDKNLQRINLNNLSALFAEIKDYEKSMNYAKQGHSLALEMNDTLSIINSLSNLVVGEIFTRQYQLATQHTKECIRLSELIQDPTHMINSYVNLGEIAMQTAKYQDALQYFQKGLQHLKTYATSQYELKVYWGLSQSYYYLKQYPQARLYHEKAMAKAQEVAAAKELNQLYLLGAELFEELQDPLQALEYRKLHQALNDSLLNAETQQNIQRLDVVYQTSVKEKEIAQQSLIITKNKLEIQKKNNVIYLSLAAVIALLSALVIIYILFRNKQKASAEKLANLQRENEMKVLMALMEGEEKERSRLARELHDGVGGILSATKMHLSVLRHEKQQPDHAAKLEHTLSMLDNASQEIRTIAHNLSPEILERYELAEALENFCQKVSNQKLQVDFYSLGEGSGRLKSSIKLIIYRMVQELVNNILKHAEASHALVQLSQHEQVLSITVEDNGRGFVASDSKGIGLLNLQARVKDLGGQFSIESSGGSGTTAYLEFDLTPLLEKQLLLSAAV